MPPIIDSDADVAALAPRQTGYIPRDYEAVPPGTVQFCEPMPGMLRIPRVEWDERIKELEAKKATLSDLRKAAGLKTLNQGMTNYCHSFGTVNAIRLIREANGLPPVDFSPTGVAAQFQNFRNANNRPAGLGGNTYQNIPWIAEHGIPLASDWPLNKIDRKYATPDMKARAAQHKLTEWYELPRNDFDAAASCLLRGIPVVMGLAWWGHMICGMTLRKVKGGYGIEIWNSHGPQYGDDGCAILTERRATAFDQAAPRVVSLSKGNA